jgi:multiple sugar transport system ATP-binding protein
MAEVNLRDVRKAYGSVQVLRGIDVDVADGEFVALVGPSGCGKSTLLRMIAGLEDIAQGEIRIDDRLVNNVPPKQRDVAMVFQNYALYPHMTVARNMGFSLKLAGRPQKEIDERVAAAAAILDLSALLDRYPRQLSGGQRQRGARHRARPAGVPVRRAAFQPRRQAPGADARRDQGAAPAPAHHHGLCDARSGRGHDHG